MSLYSRNHLANIRINAEWTACREYYGGAVINLAVWHARRSELNLSAVYWCQFVLRQYKRLQPQQVWGGAYG